VCAAALGGPQPDASPTTSTRSWCTCATDQTPPALAIDEPARAIARRGKTPHQGDRPLPRRDQLPDARLAVLDLYITHATNGIKFTKLERQRLKRIRYEDHEQTIPEEVTAA
jgi:hypothetical protein